jgi:hypothetical protein
VLIIAKPMMVAVTHALVVIMMVFPFVTLRLPDQMF